MTEDDPLYLFSVAFRAECWRAGTPEVLAVCKTFGYWHLSDVPVEQREPLLRTLHELPTKREGLEP